MKNLKNFFITFIILFFIIYIKVEAYNVSSSNNPGSNYSSDGADKLEGYSTLWISPYLRTIRIRIFRGNTDITGGRVYYSIVDNQKKCYKSLSSVQLCETDGYNYSTNKDTTGVTCSSQNINLGCIASSNLSKSWDVYNYNGTYLDNYLKSNDYSNLKEILSHLGYNNLNFKDDDVVIVEPATLVKCSGTNYFGTATAMTRKNISFRGKSGNICKTGDKYGGYTFQNLFKSMYKAFKITSSCSDTSYNGCGYFKYNVSGMGYVNPKGNIKIEIKSNNSLITSTSVRFKIYSGNYCSGTLIDTVTTSSGIANIKNLNLGTYTVCQDSNPNNGYVETPVSSGGKTQTKNLSSSGQTYTFEYTKNCDSELANSTKSVEELFNLYKKYGLNGLLKINQPSCTVIPSCNSENLSINNCLSADVNNSFSPDNLSCYDGNPITDDSENYIGFCKQTFNVSNNLDDMDTFYSYSGQFLIRKKIDVHGVPYMEVFKNKLDPSTISEPEKIYTDSVATSTSQKICYVLSGRQPSQKINSDPASLEIYFGSNEPLVSVPNVLQTTITDVDNGLVENKYSIIYNYNFRPIYLEKITGKISNEKTNVTTDAIVGLVSKFNYSTGTIPFSIKYGSTTLDSNFCKYDTTKQIVKFNENNAKDKGKLDLEFRTVDSKKPFSNRNPNANWENHEEIITNGINSYGLDANGLKHSPKYKIILTSEDIQNIREYNELPENSYDSYNIDCNFDENGIQVCKNSFISLLENGTLNGKSMNYKLIIRQ